MLQYILNINLSELSTDEASQLLNTVKLDFLIDQQTYAIDFLSKAGFATTDLTVQDLLEIKNSNAIKFEVAIVLEKKKQNKFQKQKQNEWKHLNFQ